MFDITPTLCEPDQSSSIFLVYRSSHYGGCEKIGTQTNHDEAIRTDDELNQIDTDIENVNNTENGTTESDTRTPIKATPEEWKKNIKKKLRMSGKEYISQREKSARKSS